MDRKRIQISEIRTVSGRIFPDPAVMGKEDLLFCARKSDRYDPLPRSWSDRIANTPYIRWAITSFTEKAS